MNKAITGARNASFPAWLTLPGAHLLLLIAFTRPAGFTEWSLFTTFLLITVCSSYQLFSDRRPFSLNKIWWLFGAVFLGIAPSLQASLHYSPWHAGDIRTDTMLRANLLIMLCLGLYYMIRRFFSRQRQAVITGPPVFPHHYVQRFVYAAPVLMLLCGIALLFVYGINGLFLRGYQEAISHRYNSTFQLLFDKGIRGILLYLSVSAIFLYRQKHIGKFFLTGILIFAFLLNFPLAIPRYLALTFYLSWLLASGWRWLYRGHAFIFFILGVLLLAAPLADVARYAGKDMITRIEHPVALFKKAYLVTDYDAYSSLCRTIQFVEQSGNTHGRQLEGVLLFFVPRNAWPDKPIGSGALLFTRLNFEFKNVSCTYLAEGYINFGLAGSLLFVFIIALFIARYDRFYWDGKNVPGDYTRIFYLVATGMILFVLRGDLLSSFAFSCGLFFSGLVLHRLLITQKIKKTGDGSL